LYDSGMSNLVLEPRLLQPIVLRHQSSEIEIRASWAWSLEQEVGIGTGDEVGQGGRLAVREYAEDLRRLADA
jgi:hypothetical protein